MGYKKNTLWHGSCKYPGMNETNHIGASVMNSELHQKRELRRGRRGTITYHSGCGNWGRATWLNISRTGAALRLGRYLRPGRVLYLESDDKGPVPKTVIPAEVAWCKAIPGTLDFRVGLHVHRPTPAVALAFAQLGAPTRENKKHLETVTNAAWDVTDYADAPLPNAAAGHLTHAV